MEGTVEIPKSLVTVKITNANLLTGKPVSPLDKLKILTDTEFTEMVLHWADGYLSKKYGAVRRCDGAGDKGRDVIGINKVGDGSWDNYQCKNYKNKLAPSHIYIELGKLCYYTWKGDYTVPIEYFFVSPEGVGPSLLDLLSKPDELRKELISNWDGHCKNRITSTQSIELEGDLKEYIDKFDFSIFKSKEPHELVNELRETSYYGYWFGLTSPKYRPQTSTPVLSEKENELRYVKQLLLAYNEESSNDIKIIADIEGEKKLYSHFNRQRVCFYCAEALRAFARDAWPPETEVFESLMEEIFHGISTRVSQDFAKPLQKIDSVLELSATLQLTSNPLVGNLEISDKHGICHHLINENKISWIEE